jgi:hypothetical protein
MEFVKRSPKGNQRNVQKNTQLILARLCLQLKKRAFNASMQSQQRRGVDLHVGLLNGASKNERSQQGILVRSFKCGHTVQKICKEEHSRNVVLLSCIKPRFIHPCLTALPKSAEHVLACRKEPRYNLLIVVMLLELPRVLVTKPLADVLGFLIGAEAGGNNRR